MKTDIKTKIYSAQCIGNVEPIEYMTPYPSMRSLIEGQTIKFSDQMMNEIYNITNQDFFDLVMQTSNWLQSIGIETKEYIFYSCNILFCLSQSTKTIDKLQIKKFFRFHHEN